MSLGIPSSASRAVLVAAVSACLLSPSLCSAEVEQTLAERLAAAEQSLDDDPRRADTILSELKGDAAPIEDYVCYLGGLAKQRSGDIAGAQARFSETVTAWPTSPVARKAAALLAPLLLKAGDSTALLSLARRHAQAAGASPDADAAALALAAGRALADSDPVAAAGWLGRSRRFAAGSSVGAEAASLLSDLRRLRPELQPSSAAGLLEEARLAGREGDSVGQSTWLDRILREFPADRHAIDAALLRARSVAAAKGRLEAAVWLEERAQRAPTSAGKVQLLFAAATDRWNSDDNAGARDVFARLVAVGTRGAEEQRAHYSLGRIAEAEGMHSSATAHYRMASTGPVSEVARESRWRAGWVAYLSGDFSTAAQRFGSIAEVPIEPAAREEALYWQARSLERSGDIERARPVYQDLVSSFPDGFYALLAEPRSGLEAPVPRIAELAPSDLPEAARIGFERTRLLHDAGFHELALDELRALEQASQPSDERALLPRLQLLGAHDRALRSALELYHKGALREDELYPFLYPHAYSTIVDREARARGVDPFLVYSLIRQESLFDRRAVSPASAYGLMQLLLSTARRMAAADSAVTPLDREDLFQPEINIRLGITYLAELARRFGSDEVFMLAGYNAGENAAERWKSRLGSLDRDELIERISYRETRDYVKKVLRNYRNYRRLYGDANGGGIPKRAE